MQKLLLSMVICLLLTSCKNTDKTKSNETTTKDTSGTNVTQTEVAPEIAGGVAIEFYTLSMEVTDLTTLLPSANIKKILLVFQDSSNTTAGLSLKAYGAMNNGKIMTPGVNLTLETTVPTKTFAWPIRLSAQELTLRELKGALDLPKTQGPILPNQFQKLRFIPKRRADGYIYYAIELYTTTAGAGTTNPSPPATPCDNLDCDFTP